MKKFLTTICCFAFALSLGAQDAINVTANDPVVKKFTQTYDLDSDQVLKMIIIQERRIRNLNEITDLENTDATTYHRKRRAINSGTKTSILMMMTPTQRTAFKAALLAVREQKAVKAAELKEGGLEYEQIQIELIELDDAMY